MNSNPPSSPEAVEEYVRVQSLFVRHRNCLMLTADFSPLYVDYYLHLMQLKVQHAALEDGLFKSLMAYFTLHLVSRPWKEYHAWTLNLKRPLLANLFVSGSSMSESVIGRIFTENVKQPAENILFAQNMRGRQEPQNSAIEIPSEDVESWVESYYAQSEQRLAKAFYLGGDRYALVAAEPGADHDWLSELTAASVLAMADGVSKEEETKLLEARKFSFYCGCTVEKIAATLKPMAADFADLFESQGYIEVNCPRCGACYKVLPDMLDASK